MIHTHSAAKTFRTPAGSFEALKPLSLSIDGGEYVAITGPSGSGKSTLLNLIGGIDQPSEGSVSVNGRDITQLSESRLARFRGRHVGIVFQFFQLIPTLTVQENVQMAMDLVGTIPARDRKRRSSKVIDQVGLHRHRNKLPSALSGGEQQRVAIARSIANRPGVLLADEPTGNLDSENSDRINEMFQAFSKTGITVMVATHDTAKLDQYDRVLRFVDGSLASDSNPADGDIQ